MKIISERDTHHVYGDDGESIAVFSDINDAREYVHGMRRPELTFSKLREVNVRRCEAAFHRIQAWSLCDWATAMGGECGEALNVVKKLRRLETSEGACRVDEKDVAELKRKLGAELADLVIYADLLAEAAGVDLGAAVVEKFNLVSEEQRCEIRL